jgi:FkbM family methyltransferase
MLNHFLSKHDLHPVLVDVGASGEPPTIWKPIAPNAIYVGFDPDSREVREIPGGRYHRATIVNKAISDDPAASQIQFYLTHSPYCSSTLKPNQTTLNDYYFADLMNLEGEAVVPATTFNAVLKQLSLAGIDWLKIDTQGTDLRLFRSLAPEIQARVLALDIEPQLVETYEDEITFPAVHQELTHNGWWLSNLNVMGTLRMRRASLAQITGYDEARDSQTLMFNIKRSPAWFEARYLRTLDWLAAHKLSQREYLLLWVFALVDGQPGYALDVAVEYERRFGQDAFSVALKAEPIRQIRTKLRRRHWLGPLRRLLQAVAT